MKIKTKETGNKVKHKDNNYIMKTMKKPKTTDKSRLRRIRQQRNRKKKRKQRQ